MSFAACQPDHDPPSLINKLRVLGVRAEPPQVRLGGTTTMDMLVVGHKEDAKLCYAWAFCPIALSLEGNFRCVDDDLLTLLGTGATADLSSAQVQEAMNPDKLTKVLAKHGFKLPSQLDQGGGNADINAIAKQLASFEFFILFKVADSREFGGTCPTDAKAMLDVVCDDRKQCLAGYKRLNFAMLPKYYNENPYFDGIELTDVKWPEGATPTVVPYDPKPSAWDQVLDDGVDAELFEGYGPTALKVTPLFDEKVRESITAEEDDTETGKEEILFSWFSSEGKYQKQRTYHDFADNLFLAPEFGKGETENVVSLWVVMRDRRNGTAWMQRRVKVVAGKSNPKKPLCEINKKLEGCDDKK